MDEPTIFLRKPFASENKEKHFLLIGRAWISEQGATIEYAIYEPGIEREAVRLTIPISRMNLDFVDVVTISLSTAYAKCLAQKLWTYTIGQTDECLKKTRDFDPNLDWTDWFNVMTACLQTNGDASASDTTKALLECIGG
jgi:hypothetical protein